MSLETLKPLIIGRVGYQYEIETPIVQGGMSIKVADVDLVKGVAACGAIGTLGSVGISYGREEYMSLPVRERDRQCLRDELQKLKGTEGMYGVNLLTAVSDYNELVKISAENGAKFIVSGAGLPLNLPELTADHPEVALVPIVSSARALKLICEKWYSKYKRLPDFVVVEEPSTAGGHLGATPKKGFTMEQRLYAEEFKLQNIILEIKDYFNKNEISIPLIAAGGIWDRSDIDYALGLGFDGVQMATRFVCTNECGVSSEFKQKYIDSTPETIVNFTSPLGLYGRAVRTKFLDNLMDENSQSKDGSTCIACLDHCSKRVCLANALDRAYKGDVENGIVFAGSNAYRAKEKGIISVRQVFDELTK